MIWIGALGIEEMVCGYTVGEMNWLCGLRL